MTLRAENSSQALTAYVEVVVSGRDDVGRRPFERLADRNRLAEEPLQLWGLWRPRVDPGHADPETLHHNHLVVGITQMTYNSVTGTKNKTGEKEEDG